MRKLILQMGISMDGKVAAPDGSHPWGDGDEDPAAKGWKLESYAAAAAHLMDRVTYEDMSRVWPNSEGEYADVMNTIPKVVFSKTLRTAEWPEARIAAGDLAEEIEASWSTRASFATASPATSTGRVASMPAGYPDSAPR